MNNNIRAIGFATAAIIGAFGTGALISKNIIKTIPAQQESPASFIKDNKLDYKTYEPAPAKAISEECASVIPSTPEAVLDNDKLEEIAARYLPNADLRKLDKCNALNAYFKGISPETMQKLMQSDGRGMANVIDQLDSAARSTGKSIDELLSAMSKYDSVENMRMSFKLFFIESGVPASYVKKVPNFEGTSNEFIKVAYENSIPAESLNYKGNYNDVDEFVKKIKRGYTPKLEEEYFALRVYQDVVPAEDQIISLFDNEISPQEAKRFFALNKYEGVDISIDDVIEFKRTEISYDTVYAKVKEKIAEAKEATLEKAFE